MESERKKQVENNFNEYVNDFVPMVFEWGLAYEKFVCIWREKEKTI